MASKPPVRPSVALLTEFDAREYLAKPLLRLCSEHGPTAVAKTVGGVDEKTIRNARDEKSTLGIDTAANLLALDPLALDGFLNHFGRRSVPIGAVCNTDAMKALACALHVIAEARSPNSPGGSEITFGELQDMEPALLEALGVINFLLSQLGKGEGVE